VRCSVYKFSPAAKRGFFMLLLCLVLAACSEPEKPAVTQAEADAFVSTIIDMAKARVEHGKSYEDYGQAIDEIYADKAIDRQFIDSFLARISDHPDLQEQIFLQISDSLQTLSEKSLLNAKTKPDSAIVKLKIEEK